MTRSTPASRSGSSSSGGTRNGIRASETLRRARTSRRSIAVSLERNARAISGTVSPPTLRSVSAIRASGFSAGWQQVNSIRSRSSSSAERSKSGSGS